MSTDLQLSDSEWDLMKIIWECAPASVNEIAEHAQQITQWHPKTVRTMLIRLHKKGIVSYTVQNGVQHYQPCFSREACESHAAQSFLQRVFDGALTPMVAHFSRKQKLTIEEKQALLKLLNDDDENENERGAK
jgi:BlaI family penicillinase repressor